MPNFYFMIIHHRGIKNLEVKSLEVNWWLDIEKLLWISTFVSNLETRENQQGYDLQPFGSNN